MRIGDVITIIFIGRLRSFDAQSLIFCVIYIGSVRIGEEVLTLNVWWYKLFVDVHLIVVSKKERLMVWLLENFIDKIVHYLYSLATNSMFGMNLLNHLEDVTISRCILNIHFFILLTPESFKNYLFTLRAVEFE